MRRIYFKKCHAPIKLMRTYAHLKYVGKMQFSFGWEAKPFRAKMMKILVIFALIFGTQGQKDYETILEAWRNATLENIEVIADFSAKVMRPQTTAFLANQKSIFKEVVRRRLEPILDDPNTFEELFTLMSLDVDCIIDPKVIPTSVDALVTSRDRIFLQKSLSDWVKAECLRRSTLTESFLEIDSFYDFSPENFENFCRSPQNARSTIETKLQNLINALRQSDEIVTIMFEDLTRTPNSTPLPAFSSTLEATKEFLLLQFQSRINTKPLNQPCPRPDATNQIDIVVQNRPTRPTTTTSTTTARVNQFLLNAFNLRNGK